MAATVNYEVPPTRAPAPGARAAVILLLTINLFNYIDRYVLAAVLRNIQGEFLGNDPAAATKLGSLATAFMVSYMIAAPIFGFLADRMSRWMLIGFSVTVWSLASGASGLAGTFTMLFLTRCFVGIGEAGYGPAAPTLISDLYPVERRGSVLAWFYMALPVGSALGFAFGGLVAAYIGWRWAFYLVVPPGLVLAILCFRMRKGEALANAAAAAKHKATLSEYLALLKIPSYLLDTAGMVMMTFAIGGFSFFMPTYLESAGAGPQEKVNTIFGAMLVVTGISATLVGGFVGDYLRRFVSGSYFLVSAAGIILAAVFMLLMIRSSFQSAVPWAWIWLFCALFFLFLNTGPSNTILANVSRPNVRATAFALNILIIHALGDAISPPILGAIHDHYKSWNPALYWVCAVMAGGAVFWAWGALYLQRDTDAVERAEVQPA